MITNYTPLKYKGLSTDEKPRNALDKSVFLELDTGDLYYYSESWQKIGEAPTPPTTLKVMTYNVGQWYIGNGSNVPSAKDLAYYELQSGILQRADADVLLITEYRTPFSASGRTAESVLSPYFPYIKDVNDSGYMGRAFCSKYPISNYTHHSFNNGVSNGRYYDTVTINVDGEEITLVVTHLIYEAKSDKGRIAQLNELVTFLGTLDTFICGGDFNTLDCRSTMGSDYTNMIAPLINAGFHCANCSSEFLVTYSDEPTGTWVGCLDNIITSADISILSASVDDAKLHDGINEKTDHMPLIAELKL